MLVPFSRGDKSCGNGSSTLLTIPLIAFAKKLSDRTDKRQSLVFCYVSGPRPIARSFNEEREILTESLVRILTRLKSGSWKAATNYGGNQTYLVDKMTGRFPHLPVGLRSAPLRTDRRSDQGIARYLSTALERIGDQHFRNDVSHASKRRRI